AGTGGTWPPFTASPGRSTTWGTRRRPRSGPLCSMSSKPTSGGCTGWCPGARGVVVRALAPGVVACGIPAQPFYDLIAANRQDQVVSRYPEFGDLEDYCRLSANPVGRIVLHVFGAATPEREALSDRVCTALQLAEHWQDVAEDLRAGRIYLPQEDMERFGCTEDDLAAPRATPEARALMAFEERRARGLLD